MTKRQETLAERSAIGRSHKIGNLTQGHEQLLCRLQRADLRIRPLFSDTLNLYNLHVPEDGTRVEF